MFVCFSKSSFDDTIKSPQFRTYSAFLLLFLGFCLLIYITLVVFSFFFFFSRLITFVFAWRADARVTAFVIGKLITHSPSEHVNTLVFAAIPGTADGARTGCFGWPLRIRMILFLFIIIREKNTFAVFVGTIDLTGLALCIGCGVYNPRIVDGRNLPHCLESTNRIVFACTKERAGYFASLFLTYGIDDAPLLLPPPVLVDCYS